MSSFSWIRIVLLAGVMLSLPVSNASAASIDLRALGATTFNLGESLDVDVYILLDESDRGVGVGSVTLHLEYGGGVVSVVGSGAGSPFSTAVVNPIPPQEGNPNSDFIVFSQFGATVNSAEVFIGSLTLTGTTLGSYDLVARRFGSFPLISPAGGGANRYDFTSDESLTVTIVPEPGTLVLLGASLAGLAFLRRRVA